MEIGNPDFIFSKYFTLCNFLILMPIFFYIEFKKNNTLPLLLFHEGKQQFYRSSALPRCAFGLLLKPRHKNRYSKIQHTRNWRMKPFRVDSMSQMRIKCFHPKIPIPSTVRTACDNTIMTLLIHKSMQPMRTACDNTVMTLLIHKSMQRHNTTTLSLGGLCRDSLCSLCSSENIKKQCPLILHAPNFVL